MDLVVHVPRANDSAIQRGLQSRKQKRGRTCTTARRTWRSMSGWSPGKPVATPHWQGDRESLYPIRHKTAGWWNNITSAQRHILLYHLKMDIQVNIYIYIWSSFPTPLPPRHGHGSATLLAPSPPWCGGGVVLSPFPLWCSRGVVLSPPPPLWCGGGVVIYIYVCIRIYYI